MNKILKILIVGLLLGIIIYFSTKLVSKEQYDNPVDCVGSWNDWGQCDPSTGKQSRTFNIKTSSSNGGIPCPSSPELTDCPVDCAGSWSDWGQCDTKTGTMTRNFIPDPKVTVKNGGIPCPSDEIANCPVNCQGDFGPWSDCNPDNNNKVRKFIPTVDPAIITKSGGIPCPPDQVESCPKKIDCDGNWSDWGQCDPNTGQHKKTFTITQQPANGGKECPSPLTQIDNCPVSCTGSYDTNWSSCDQNTGIQKKKFNIVNTPKNGGNACPPLELTQSCDVDCQGDWSNWSKCDPNTNTQERHIVPTYIKRGNGKDCQPPQYQNCKPCDGIKCDPGTVCIDGNCVKNTGINYCYMYQNNNKNIPNWTFAGETNSVCIPCEQNQYNYPTGCDSCTIDNPVFSNDSVIPTAGTIKCTGCRSSSSASKKCDISIPDITINIDDKPGAYFYDSTTKNYYKDLNYLYRPSCYLDSDCDRLAADKTKDPNLSCKACNGINGVRVCKTSC